MGLVANAVVGLQPGPGDDGEAGRLQTLLDGGDVAGVDVAAAGSALDGAPRTGAEQGDLAWLSQGKGVGLLVWWQFLRGFPGWCG
ncbi:hypothetical protein HMPREF1129_1267 [Actinomyces naeslundii str. Howell 279]|uniref:Uncharacterized protein n=1 Tax=Actinomyces naeslundii (strain ATCC 12104 / DSM 43013 / CCUG 2238 / JCM 8349 / NCTC 10301 / Howell 279) TaxID=1115803 RepID=J3ADQ8_ACTNH|nr:hypothetical protein HMPREF1129_1267 [Actinomyces naeslundii str. Howell 279]